MVPVSTPAYTPPIEIWEEVCKYACTDGFTGRSLSCISRTINQLTKWMKLYSLATDRTRQLFNLVAKLERNEEKGDDKDVEGIRHLLVLLPHLFLEDALDGDDDDSDYSLSSDSSSSESDESDCPMASDSEETRFLTGARDMGAEAMASRIF